MKMTLLALTLLPAAAMAQGPLDTMPLHDVVEAAHPQVIRAKTEELLAQVSEGGAEAAVAEMASAMKDQVDSSTAGASMAAGVAAGLASKAVGGNILRAQRVLSESAQAAKSAFHQK